MKKSNSNNSIYMFDERKKKKRLYTKQTFYTARDGHKCNSMKEVEIDDFLFIHKIPHDKPRKASFKGQFYKNSYKTPDWVIDRVIIEYFGGCGFLKKYENNALDKEEELKKGKREFIILRAKDNYPHILYKRFHKLAGMHRKLNVFFLI